MKRLRNFNKIVFPSGILACKYYPDTLNVTAYLSSYESIINVVNSYLSDKFGDAMIYPYNKYLPYLLPFSHVFK